MAWYYWVLLAVVAGAVSYVIAWLVSLALLARKARPDWEQSE